MARRRTLPQNIRKYKQEYLRLLAYEARLNHQLFNMKKRIKLLAQEEQLRLTEKALLSEQLQKIQQQKKELESQPASKQRNAQLKRVEKEYKQVKASHSRNQYQLDQLEVKKDKDNVVKLLVKEAKRDDVTVRIQSAYETWMYFEQIQQWELATEQAIQADAELTPLETPSALHQNFDPWLNTHQHSQPWIACTPELPPVQQSEQATFCQSRIVSYL